MTSLGPVSESFYYTWTWLYLQQNISNFIMIPTLLKYISKIKQTTNFPSEKQNIAIQMLKYYKIWSDLIQIFDKDWVVKPYSS